MEFDVITGGLSKKGEIEISIRGIPLALCLDFINGLPDAPKISFTTSSKILFPDGIVAIPSTEKHILQGYDIEEAHDGKNLLVSLCDFLDCYLSKNTIEFVKFIENHAK